MTRLESFARDYELKNQIRRAAISVMSNIAEGFGRDSNRDFIQFLSVAKASANEVQSQLYIALDQKYVNLDQFNQGYQLCNETIRTIGGLIAYLKKSSYKGPKFKESNVQGLKPNSEP